MRAWLFEQVGLDPNAAVPSEAEIDRVIGLLRDPDRFVRRAAASALGELRVRRAVPALVETLKDDATVWDAAGDAAAALGQIGGDEVIDPLISALDHQFAAGPALVALGRLRHPRAVEPLIRYLDRTGNPSAATVLGNTRDRRAVPSLIAALGHADPSTRFYAARALGKIGDERALPALENVRQHDHTREPRRTWRRKSVSDVAAIAIERIRSAPPRGPRDQPR